MPFEALNLKAPVEAVLFDLDGTLVETHIDFPAMKAAMLALAASEGMDTESLQPLDILSIVRRATAHVSTRLGPNSAAAFRAEAFAHLETLEITGCSTPIDIPGAAEWTAALRDAGIVIGVVTRNCRTVSLELLDRFEIAYDALLSRDDVQLTKPDPSHLWVALDKLDVAPGNSIMVGDHWMDVEAGITAGCAATIGILSVRDPSWFDPAPPDMIAEHLAEVHRLLGP